jgi:spore coat polysaccharide biosynthesis protein SpsF (cytidylyltransferase family)
MKNIAIIQARLESNRLPSKILLKIGNKTILEHIISRLRKCSKINKIFVASPLNMQNQAYTGRICLRNDIQIFYGSQNDVLSRYAMIEKIESPDNIIRITADCPFIDPLLIDKGIIDHEKLDCDFTTNSMIDHETFPDGLDFSIIKGSVINTLDNMIENEVDREHVVTYIMNNKKAFNIEIIEAQLVDYDIDLSKVRLTIDYIEDYIFLKKFYNKISKEYGESFTLLDIIDFLYYNKSIYKESIKDNRLRNISYHEQTKE